MRFPKFWKVAKDGSGKIVARGWSESSQAEADQNAQDRLHRILTWLRSKDDVGDLDRYHYVIDDNICEPVIDVIQDESHQELAVISRNAYGSLVLNANRVMIIDIDIESTVYSPGFLAKLFGAKPTTAQEIFQREMENLHTWQQQHQQISFRVYRTAAGLRAIVTSREYPQIDVEVIEILNQLHSDPLYRHLCISQKCFRARLSPKPWRIGLKPPVQRFPFESSAAEAEFDNWYRDYASACKQWSVCEYLQTIGEEAAIPCAQQIVELHDSLCCNPGRPLA